MTTVLELLFKYRPYLYEKGDLGFRPIWPSYATWLLIAAALVFAFWLYRRTAGVLAPSWRWGLTGLRMLTLLILLLIFLQPVLVLHSVIPQKSFVAIAYDTSKSMEIRDGPEGESRLDLAKYLLRPAGNPVIEELAKKFKLRFFRFSSSAERTAAFDDPQRHGNLTDMSRTISQIVGEIGAAPISGVVLISDGADNKSANLTATTAQLRARNIPIYAVGVGSSDFKRDAEVISVAVPRKVLKDTIIEADVTARASGYAGSKANLVVRDGARILHNEEITLGSDGEVKTYKVIFSSEAAGSRLVDFRIEPLPDETVPENNDQTVLVRVEDEHPEILYVEGEPRWTYAFLHRAATEDKNVRLVTLLRQADGKFLRQGIDSPTTLEKGFPTDKNELYRYKAIILGSVEANFFTFDQLRMISDFVSQRGGSILALGGKNSFGQGGYINTPLEDVLPVALRSGSEFQDSEFKVRLTGYGWDNPITRVSLAEAENRKRWENAPALVGFNPTAGPKPGATVLIQGTVPDARGQSPVILAFQRFGRGKSVAFTTASTWRWKMGLDHRDNFHDVFWKQLLRWLVSDAPDPVNLQTEKQSYSPEEPVVIRAEVNDSGFTHLNNAQVFGSIRSPSGETSRVEFTWQIDKEGQYSAAFNPKEQGVHEISAEAFQGTKSVGIAKANFRIADSNEEFHNAALNTGLMERLAQETGGRYYSPKDARTLAEDISYIDNGASRIEEKDLWDMPFLFLLLIGAASTEWFFRKRKGLA